jgi:hypothetical protein
MNSPNLSISKNEIEPSKTGNFISQEVLDCLYNKIKSSFDFFMKNLQSSVKEFEKIEHKNRELTRIMLFKMSEDPLKSLRFRNQVIPKETKFLKTSQIFGSVFSNSDINKLKESSDEDVEITEEVNTDLFLCYEVNKHMYGYLFSVMRADPCLLLRLFRANDMSGSNKVFSVEQQVNFVLELFPPDFSCQIGLVFYSKLIKLFLESLFSIKNKDFFKLLLKVDFSISSSKKFHNHILNMNSTLLNHLTIKKNQKFLYLN